MPKEVDIGLRRKLLDALATYGNRSVTLLPIDGGDDPVTRANLNALRSLAETNDAEVQDGSFHHWFAYPTNSVRPETSTTDCNENSRSWPDSIDHVSSQDLDEFFDHSDTCPYHGAILAAEDANLYREFDSTLSLVSGLDPHGSIDDWEHLTTSAATLKRNWDNWKKQAELDKEFLFDFLGLYNDGRRIATAGRFVDLNAQPSIHELNPLAGLQIRGITGKDPDDDVLLGFYPLAGVRHQDTEQLLNLPNGFKVGLLVNQHNQTQYTVGFRCVKSEVGEVADHSYVGTGTRMLPGFMASVISGARFQPTQHIIALAVMAVGLGLLIPFLSSPNSNESAAPTFSGQAVVHGRSPEPPPRTPDPPPTPSIKHIEATPAVPSQYLAVFNQNLGENGARLDVLPLSPSLDQTQKTQKGTQVEAVKTWMLQMYETGPDKTEHLILTQYADSERLRDGIEKLARDLSLRVDVLVLDPKQLSPLPDTGLTVKWTTSYRNTKVASLEAEIVHRDNDELNLPLVKQDCSRAKCDERLLIANAIRNVYGMISSYRKSEVPFAEDKLNACGCWRTMPDGSTRGNGLGNTGFSGLEFDDLDCLHISGGSSSTQ